MKFWQEGAPDIDFPDLDSIVIVGEYTTSDGPYNDDHFLVLIRMNGEELHYPTHQATSIVSHLQRITPTPVKYGLANITDYASRIMFPPILAGKPLYEWTTHDPTTILGRLFHLATFGLLVRTSTEWSMDVRRYLGDLQSTAARPSRLGRAE